MYKLSRYCYPALICFFASLFYFYEYVQMNLFNVLAPDIIHIFHINALELGQLSSYYFFSFGSLVFLAGLLLDKYPTKIIMLSTLGLCIFGLVIFSYTTSFEIAKIARAMMGIGNAFCYLSCMKLASQLFPIKRFGFVVALIGIMAMLGGLTSQVPIELILGKIGYRSVLLLDILLGVFVWIIIAIFVSEPVKCSDQLIHKIKYGNIKNVILNYINWLSGLLAALLCLPIFIFTALWGKMYLVQVHHITNLQAAMSTSMIFVGHIIGSPIFGWLSARHNKLQVVSVASMLSLFVVTLIIYQAQLHYLILYILFLLLGITTSSQIITYHVVAETNPSEIKNSALGFMASLVILSGAAIQIFYSWLMNIQSAHKLSGNIIYEPMIYTKSLSIFPIAFMLCVIISLVIHRRILQYEKKNSVVRFSFSIS